MEELVRIPESWEFSRRCLDTLFVIRPLILAIKTILPPTPCSLISLAAAWAGMNEPMILTSSILRNGSGDKSIALHSPETPAVVTTPRIGKRRLGSTS